MWNDLDIYTKNNLMKIYNRHGISSLKDMQQHYDDFEQRQFAKGGYMNPYAYGGNMFLNGGDYNIKDNLTSSNVFRNYNDDFSYDPVAKVNSLIEQQEVMNNINNGDKSYETFINDPFFDSTEINKRVKRGYNQPFKTFNNLTSYDSPYLYKQPEDLNNKEITYDYSVNNSTTTNNNPTTTSNPTTTDNTNNKVTTQSPINNSSQNKRNYKKTDEYLTNLYEYLLNSGLDAYSKYSFNNIKDSVKKFNDSHPYYRDVMGNIRFNDIQKKENQFYKRYIDAKNAYLKRNNVSDGDKLYEYYSELFDIQHPYYGSFNYRNLRKYNRNPNKATKLKESIKNERKKDEYKKALNAYISRMTKKPGNKRTKEQLRVYFDIYHPYYGDLRKYH